MRVDFADKSEGLGIGLPKALSIKVKDWGRGHDEMLRSSVDMVFGVEVDSGRSPVKTLPKRQVLNLNLGCVLCFGVAGGLFYVVEAPLEALGWLLVPFTSQLGSRLG